MCDQCTAQTEMWPTPLEGWALVRANKDGYVIKAGQWGLVACNDPTWVWDPKPRPEPPEPPEGVDDPESWEDLDQWFENEAGVFEQQLQASGDSVDHWRLVEAARKCGYTPGKIRFGTWLFNFLGEWIADHKPFPYLDQDDPEYVREHWEEFGYGNPDLTNEHLIKGPVPQETGSE